MLPSLESLSHCNTRLQRHSVAELDVTMALCGLRDIKAVDEKILVGGREGAMQRLAAV